MKTTRQMWAVAVGTVAAVVVLPLAAAWACTSLATLNVTPGSGKSGQVVTGAGSGFGSATSGNSPVEIRWNSSTGPLLATVIPTAQRTISFSFVAPAGDAGYYTVIASQKTAAGGPVNGTPARATFALNDPPAQTIAGAGGATTVDQQAAAQAPEAVAFSAPLAAPQEQTVAAPAAQAPVVQAPIEVGTPAPVAAAPAQAAARPVEIAPAQPLAPIAPSGARSVDILAPGGVDSFLGGPGLVLVLMGAFALVAALGAAALAPKRAVARRR